MNKKICAIFLICVCVMETVSSHLIILDKLKTGVQKTRCKLHKFGSKIIEHDHYHGDPCDGLEPNPDNQGVYISPDNQGGNGLIPEEKYQMSEPTYVKPGPSIGNPNQMRSYQHHDPYQEPPQYGQTNGFTGSIPKPINPLPNQYQSSGPSGYGSERGQLFGYSKYHPQDSFSIQNGDYPTGGMNRDSIGQNIRPVGGSFGNFPPQRTQAGQKPVHSFIGLESPNIGQAAPNYFGTKPVTFTESVQPARYEPSNGFLNQPQPIDSFIPPSTNIGPTVPPVQSYFSGDTFKSDPLVPHYDRGQSGQNLNPPPLGSSAVRPEPPLPPKYQPEYKPFGGEIGNTGQPAKHLEYDYNTGQFKPVSDNVPSPFEPVSIIAEYSGPTNIQVVEQEIFPQEELALPPSSYQPNSGVNINSIFFGPTSASPAISSSTPQIEGKTSSIVPDFITAFSNSPTERALPEWFQPGPIESGVSNLDPSKSSLYDNQYLGYENAGGINNSSTSKSVNDMYDSSGSVVRPLSSTVLDNSDSSNTNPLEENPPVSEIGDQVNENVPVNGSVGYEPIPSSSTALEALIRNQNSSAIPNKLVGGNASYSIGGPEESTPKPPGDESSHIPEVVDESSPSSSPNVGDSALGNNVSIDPLKNDSFVNSTEFPPAHPVNDFPPETPDVANSTDNAETTLEQETENKTLPELNLDEITTSQKTPSSDPINELEQQANYVFKGNNELKVTEILEGVSENADNVKTSTSEGYPTSLDIDVRHGGEDDASSTASTESTFVPVPEGGGKHIISAPCRDPNQVNTKDGCMEEF